ncbi:MAG: anhydro-N-acetylmuramic acid kinase [Bacteroidota bacterium]|jgi:anhydro-N-acetylmuramic acid kinase
MNRVLTGTVLGVMSGTSLDGMDLAVCNFTYENNKWSFQMMVAETIPYSTDWLNTLQQLHQAGGAELCRVDMEYGKLIGEQCKSFINKHQLKVDFIASHGHTIFHQPHLGFTKQIGHGAAIAAASGLPIVNDFRSLDVALGGQGAPLVPIGDALLFAQYDACLNLGGFANISFMQQHKRIAFDICPCNVLLNHLSNRIGMEYDKGGLISASGKMNVALFDDLNALPFYQKTGAKSLGIEWVHAQIFPLFNQYSYLSVQDLLATVSHHVAHQISRVLAQVNTHQVLVTGGGAYHSYLIELINEYSKLNMVIPDSELIAFKEAIIFALLGFLRWHGMENCLKDVTGSFRNNSGGSIWRS